MNAYTPEQARRMEDVLARMWKPAPGAGKTPFNQYTGGKNHARIQEGNRKKDEAFALIGNEWVTPTEICKQLPDHDTALRSAIYAMVRMGRLESKKHRSRVYVRRPQGEAM